MQKYNTKFSLGEIFVTNLDSLYFKVGGTLFDFEDAQLDCKSFNLLRKLVI